MNIIVTYSRRNLWWVVIFYAIKILRNTKKNPGLFEEPHNDNVFIVRRDLRFKKSGLLYQYITIFHLSLSPNHFLWEIISLILTNEYRSIHPSRHLCKGMRQNCELFPSIFHSFRHDQSRILKMYSLWNWQNKMTNALMIGKRNRIFICYREHS